jgi:hypothetical protein
VVQVVDHEQRRRARGEIGGKPIEAMQHRERRLSPVTSRGLRRGREQRSGKRGRTGQEFRPDVWTGGGQRSLERLPDDAEREFALELPPRAANVTNPAARHPRLGQQPHLPDARAALDHDKTTIAAMRRVEHGLQHSKLGPTLEHEKRSSGLEQLVCGHRGPRATDPRGAG